MLKKYTKILVIFASLNIASFIRTSEQLNLIKTNLQTIDTDQALFNWLQSLDPQNHDLTTMIKSHFNTDNQDVLNFLINQTDHINLAASIFKQYCTSSEIQQIVDFHTSEVGKKLGAIFPVVMEAYRHALENRIEEIKLAVIAYAKEHQEETN